VYYYFCKKAIKMVDLRIKPTCLMSKKTTGSTGEANRYDKIIKENLLKAVPGLTRSILGLHLTKLEPVSLELQHTRERKADFVALAEEADGNRFLLHIEFQLKDDPKMVYRMLDYAALEARKYPQMVLRHYVLYLGSVRPKASAAIQQPNLTFRFEPIWLRDVPAAVLLQSDQPEEILFAIMAKFDINQADHIVEAVIERIRQRAEPGLEFLRFIEQLRMLGNIRNLQPLINALMEKVSTYFVPQRDPLFRKGEQSGMEKGIKKGLKQGIEKGIEKGLEKGKLEVATNLLQFTEFPDEKIAALAGIQITVVQNLRQQIQADANRTVPTTRVRVPRKKTPKKGE
jgi:predicted transposase YdaD